MAGTLLDSTKWDEAVSQSHRRRMNLSTGFHFCVEVDGACVEHFGLDGETIYNCTEAA
jgi:hypothetical protein